MLSGKIWFRFRWGEWRWIEHCPQGQFLIAFQMRVEEHQGRGDDTAVNDVNFMCTQNYNVLYGRGERWGEWGRWSSPCLSGICGLKTKVEFPQHRGDDTALNDVQFICC